MKNNNLLEDKQYSLSREIIGRHARSTTINTGLTAEQLVIACPDFFNPKWDKLFQPHPYYAKWKKSVIRMMNKHETDKLTLHGENPDIAEIRHYAKGMAPTNPALVTILNKQMEIIKSFFKLGNSPPPKLENGFLFDNMHLKNSTEQVQKNPDVGANKQSSAEAQPAVAKSEDSPPSDYSPQEDLVEPITSILNPAYTIIPLTSAGVSLLSTGGQINAVRHAKQGGSNIATFFRSGMQAGIPITIGGGSLAIAGFTAAGTALPITLLLGAATSMSVGVLSGTTTLATTLYYNKFFVSKKLKDIETHIKKIPTENGLLEQKKSLTELINHALILLHGDKQQRINKSSTKIKKLDPKILYILDKIKHHLELIECNTEEIKEHCHKINKCISTLLKHSFLFYMLIKEIEHIKSIYEHLSVIKSFEEENDHPDIQAILAPINLKQYLNKFMIYEHLLKKYKEEQEYATSFKGKVHAAGKATFGIKDKKQFITFHQEVMDQTSTINADYQELKEIILNLQKQYEKLSSNISKQHVFRAYAQLSLLFYKDELSESTTYLTQKSCKEEVDARSLSFELR